MGPATVHIAHCCLFGLDLQRVEPESAYSRCSGWLFQSSFGSPTYGSTQFPNAYRTLMFAPLVIDFGVFNNIKPDILLALF